MEAILKSVTGFIMLGVALLFGSYVTGSLGATGTGGGVWDCSLGSTFWQGICNGVGEQSVIIFGIITVILLIVAAVVILQGVKLFKEVGAKK